MTLAWRFFYLAALAVSLLLNIAQDAANLELAWQLDQAKHAIQGIDSNQPDPDAVVDPDPVQWETAQR